MPIESSGFDKTAQGTLPRPKLKIANVGGLFSAMVIQMDDLVGARITRKRTFARYLDAVNFRNGNPEENPDQHLPDEMWLVDRKATETKDVIEWELASAFDFDGIKLPYRQVLKNSCAWRYRGPECGYSGGYYDEFDQPTNDINKDCCPKRFTSCKARQGSDVVLTFGGMPGVQRGDD
ncbi:phage minor tail protein L, partial [Acinetobacter baumannii]